MIDLRVVQEIIDKTLGRALEGVSKPGDKTSSFDFGKIHGMLLAVEEINDAIKAYLEEQKRKEKNDEI